MNRLIDLEMRTQTVWLSCPFDPQIVDTIKSIPGREFHKGSRRWAVPLAQVALAVTLLEPHHFRFTPRMREWWNANRGSVAEVAPEAAEVAIVDPADGYTVSRLNAEARRVLTEGLSDVWVVAELEGYERNKPNGHAYFELVERAAAGSQPIARVRAVLFAATRRRIEQELPPDLAIADGVRLRLRGRVDLYTATGSYQVIIEALDVEWAIGTQRRKRDEVLQRLEAEGIAHANLQRPWPVLPLRVGLVTAVGSDAYNDFVHELERSGFGFELTVHAARMQGRDAEGSIVAALQWFAARAGDFDVVVVTRGGGARGDLSAFDSLEIGRAVCQLGIKVVAGIGHHRDQSVLDFVAVSEKTPTAAAQALIARVDTAATRAEELATRVVASARGTIERRAARAERAAVSVERSAQRRVGLARRRLDRAASLIRDGRRPLDRAEARVERAFRDVQRAVGQSLRRQGVQLDHIEAKLRLADPRRLLERGFALVRDDDGRIVTSAATLRRLDRAVVELHDGTVQVTPRETTDD